MRVLSLQLMCLLGATKKNGESSTGQNISQDSITVLHVRSHLNFQRHLVKHAYQDTIIDVVANSRTSAYVLHILTYHSKKCAKCYSKR